MSKISSMTADGLALLRAPFPPHHISKLPKPTKKQTDDVKANFKMGIRCQLCGAWHHPDVVHLDYVGHAALTDRLLDCDPLWTWEPYAETQMGLPALDANGGLWIKLTVKGMTRIGYGHADGKTGGDAIKEAIGDALRNAAMRFGAALDLWHKGELHLEEEQEPEVKPEQRFKAEPVTQDDGNPFGPSLADAEAYAVRARSTIASFETFDEAVNWWNSAEEKTKRRSSGISQDTLNELIALIKAVPRARNAA